MNLSQAIDVYVRSRHLDNSGYIHGESVLRSFYKRVGDIPLDRLSAQQIISFLNGPRTSPTTWKNKLGFLRRFCQYWTFRDVMPTLILPPPPRCDFKFIPHIYTRNEVRALLATTHAMQQKSEVINSSTLRMFVLALYATGATVSEILDLRKMDLDFKRGRVTFQGDQPKRKRCVPMNRELQDQLRIFIRSAHVGISASAQIFHTESGKPLNRRYLNDRFRVLRKRAGVIRHDEIKVEPRMQDFRATFAVHRLTSWIERGADLNRMLPSLSAYMGYAGLAAADKYLFFTPERFRKELHKLSPQRGRSHWREDSELMHFLTHL